MTVQIKAMRMALICTVTTYCVKPNRAMGIHEPEIISSISDGNQIYVAHGSSPLYMFKIQKHIESLS